ncbi:hypothetical protein GCM10010109_71470 [Actinoplanes campanulatus]|nr:hypothetical protein GCM10010109_71470 [Actinoplanes campanulatus]GID34906.1 hypothetical protein Aca09nite_14120 [Actinoplanes campanulatus]
MSAQIRSHPEKRERGGHRMAGPARSSGRRTGQREMLASTRWSIGDYGSGACRVEALTGDGDGTRSGSSDTGGGHSPYPMGTLERGTGPIGVTAHVDGDPETARRQAAQGGAADRGDPERIAAEAATGPPARIEPAGPPGGPGAERQAASRAWADGPPGRAHRRPPRRGARSAVL